MNKQVILKGVDVEVISDIPALRHRDIPKRDGHVRTS